MAAADTLPSSTTIASSSPSPSQQQHHDHDNHQDPASPAMALRFPAHLHDETLHDAKTSRHRRPRWWLAQVFTNAYNDILRTWMGLHSSFHRPASAHPRAYPGQYHTFACSDAAALCDPDDGCCATTDAGAFSAAIGEMILEPPINVLLVCVPLGVVAYHAASPAVPSVLVFAVNVLAVVPLSSLLTDATERIALEAGDAVGAFLNVSLGNIVELILLVTLLNGHVKVVQASILGSILVNLLPILGTALVATHVTGGDDSLDGTETQMLACLLCVSVFVFMIPTAFRFTFSEAPNIDDIVVHMSRLSAVLTLVMYTAYFLHTMQSTHPDDADDEAAGGESLRTPITPPPLLRRRSSSSSSSPPPPPPGPRTLRFADGAKTQPTSDLYARRVFEVGGPPPASSITSAAATGDDVPSTDEDPSPPPAPPPPPRGRSLTGTRGPPSAHTVLLPSRSRSTHSRASSWTSQQPRLPPRSFARAGLARVLSTDRRRRAFREPEETTGDDDNDSRLGAALAAIVVLLVASLLLAVSARLLAGTLDAATRRRPLSGALVGVVLLPLAGNLSSWLAVAAVAAARDNLDLAVAVSAGSAVQVALCVAPLTVLAGWALGRPVVLALDGLEMAMLLGAAALVNLLVLGGGGGGGGGDGQKRRATGLKGGILCACFLVMGIATSFAPNGE